MRTLGIFLMGVLILGPFASAAGAVESGYISQYRPDIEKAVAELRVLNDQVAALQADIATAQGELSSNKGKVMDFNELQAIRGRIEKDRTALETATMDKNSRLIYLQNMWNYLTDDEKTLVRKARGEM